MTDEKILEESVEWNVVDSVSGKRRKQSLKRKTTLHKKVLFTTKDGVRSFGYITGYEIGTGDIAIFSDDIPDIDNPDFVIVL